MGRKPRAVHGIVGRRRAAAEGARRWAGAGGVGAMRSAYVLTYLRMPGCGRDNSIASTARARPAVLNQKTRPRRK